MVDICWSEMGGWHRPRVQPYGAISLDPAAAVLHYAQEIFEGSRPYRHADGSIWAFRPEANAARMQRSARRLAMPELPTEYFIESIRQLIAVDERWVPDAQEASLYLRPFMFAKEAFLGVRPAKKVNYYLIASPAGAYFSGGVSPLSIWLSTTYTRAGRGGMGQAKTGGNYAASLIAQQEAYDARLRPGAVPGCGRGQVPRRARRHERRAGEEGRDARDARVHSILEGITLESVLQLARDRGLNTEQRRVTLDEWRTGWESGDIVEMFACGTAAVITPIGLLKGEGFQIGSEDAVPGELTMSLREELTGIQYGRVEDRHGWMTRLDDSSFFEANTSRLSATV